MYNWQHTWREGIVPIASLQGLRSLERALTKNDPALIQGATFDPAPLQCHALEDVRGACPVAWLATVDPESYTMEDAEDEFARFTIRAAELLPDPAELRHFFNWYDELPRDKAIALLLPEVRSAIALKESRHG